MRFGRGVAVDVPLSTQMDSGVTWDNIFSKDLSKAMALPNLVIDGRGRVTPDPVVGYDPSEARPFDRPWYSRPGVYLPLAGMVLLGGYWLLGSGVGTRKGNKR